MKFTVSTVDCWYDDDDIPRLEKLGFTFREPIRPPYQLLARDGTDITHTIKAISDETEVELSTLEDLIEFTKTHGRIILDGNNITIYDDYVE